MEDQKCLENEGLADFFSFVFFSELMGRKTARPLFCKILCFLPFFLFFFFQGKDFCFRIQRLSLRTGDLCPRWSDAEFLSDGKSVCANVITTCLPSFLWHSLFTVILLESRSEVQPNLAFAEYNFFSFPSFF